MDRLDDWMEGRTADVEMLQMVPAGWMVLVSGGQERPGVQWRI